MPRNCNNEAKMNKKYSVNIINNIINIDNNIEINRNKIPLANRTH